MAQATRRNGGIIIVQVARLTQRGALLAKQVKMPRHVDGFGGCIFITFSVKLNDQHPQLMQEVDKGCVGLKTMLNRVYRK